MAMPSDLPRIDRALSILRVGADATAASLADVLWLANLLPQTKLEDDNGKILDNTSGTKNRSETIGPGEESAVEIPPAAQAIDSHARIYANQRGGGDGAFIPATFITVPAADPLPNRLAIERALKPFLKRFPSRRLKQLDGDKTAEASADRRAITPVFRPLPERWFDVLLLVEQSAAMEVWTDTVHELAALLGRHGAFRRARVLRFRAGDSVSLLTVAGQPLSPRAAADPDGRRLCLFLTNGTSVEWHRKVLIEFVRGLGRSTVVAIIQMLPQGVWGNTALGPAQEYVHSLVPASPNATLQMEDPFSGLTKRVDDPSYVPVLTLEPRDVARWAAFVMSPRRIVSPAVQLRLRSEPSEHQEPRTPSERLAIFRGIASGEAFQLLRMLAGAPLTLPIMRLIQQSVSTSQEHYHLAEVMLSGLIERVTDANATVTHDQVYYDFIPGIRELLLGTHSSQESDKLDKALQPAQERLRVFVESHTKTSIRDFRALLSDPHGLERLPASARSFLEVSRRIYESRGILPPSPTDSPLPPDKPEPPKAGTHGHKVLQGPPDHLPEQGQQPFKGEAHVWQVQRPLARLMILWVDDHAVNNEREIAEVTRLGASVIEKLNTEDGLDAVRGQRFDVIITDMARDNQAEAGLDLLKRLRGAGVTTPTIIYAARWAGSSGARERSKAAGAFACTNEPSVLLDEILRATGRNKLIQRYLDLMRGIGFHNETALSVIQLPTDAVSRELALRARSIEHLYQVFVTALAAITNCEYVQLFFGQRILRLAADHIGLDKKRYHEAGSSGVIGISHRDARTLWVPDVLSTENYLAAEETTQSELAIPILSHTSESVGILNIECVERNALSEEQIRWLEELVRLYPLPRWIPRIWIIHVESDSSVAEHMERTLRDAGFDVVRENVGRNKSILSRFRATKDPAHFEDYNCYLALVSPAATSVKPFHQSIANALARKASAGDEVRVIPVPVQPGELPAELVSLQAFVLTSNVQMGLDRLVKSIEALRLRPSWPSTTMATGDLPPTAEQADGVASRASEAFKREEYQLAIDLFSKALEIEQDADLYHQRGSAFWYSHRYPEAVADFTTALKLDPSLESDLRNVRGQALADAGQYDEALEDLNLAIANKKISPLMLAYALRARGVAHAGLGQMVDANEDFRRSGKLAPENAWLYYSVAKAWDSMSITEFAVSAPDWMIFHLYCLALYHRNPKLNRIRFLDALANVEKVTGELTIPANGIVRELAGGYDALLDRARNAMRSGEYGLALLAAEILRDSSVGKQESAIIRCICNRRLGNFDRIGSEISILFELDPPSLDAFLERGYAHLRSGDLEKADADFEKVITKTEAICGMALILSLQGNSAAARAMVESALQLAPNNAECLLSGGKIFENAGEIERARSAYLGSLQVAEFPLAEHEKNQARDALQRLARGATSS
jgi:tetratricopeptide (TPR) repeat protein